MKNEAAISAALDTMGFGKYQKIVFFQCGLAWFSYQTWMRAQGFIFNDAGTVWDISHLKRGMWSSSLQLGMLFGSLFWGSLANRRGRYYTYRRCVIFGMAFCLVLAFSFDYIFMLIVLLFVGFGIGGELALSGTYFTEFCPPKSRWVLSVLSMFMPMGGTFMSLANLIVVDLVDYLDEDWRILVALMLALEIFLSLWRQFLLESPYYLASVGKYEEADEIMRQIAIKNGKEVLYNEHRQSIIERSEPKIEEERKVGDKEGVKEALVQKPVNKKSLSYAFSKNYRRPTILLTMINFFLTWGYISLITFLPVLLSNFPSVIASTIILIQAACAIPGNLIGGFLVQTCLGRKFTFVIAMIIASFLSFMFYWTSGLVETFFVIFMNLFCLLSYGAMYTMLSESYESETRSIASGWCIAWGRLGGALSPFCTGYILDLPDGEDLALQTFAVCFALSALCALFLRETRTVKNRELRESLAKSVLAET